MIRVTDRRGARHGDQARAHQRARQTLIAALVVLSLVALVVKVALLPLKGTADVREFKDWAVSADAGGLFGAYRAPDEETGPLHAVPDYPPLSVALFTTAARFVSAVFNEPDAESRVLTFYIKLLPFTAAVLVSLLIWWHTWGATRDPSRAFLYASGAWLNPAFIVNGPILGYFDAPCFVLGLVALLMAERRRFYVAAVFAALAMLTKHQGVFFVVPLAVAAWGSGYLVRAVAVGAATLVAVLTPFVIGSGLGAMVQALAINLSEDMLSGTAFNTWWLVSLLLELLRVGPRAWWAGLPDYGVAPFATATGFEPRLLMTVIVGAGTAWIAWRMRGRSRMADMAAAMALMVHLYFVAAIAVHENHQVYMIVPLLFVAVVQRPYRWLVASVSLLAAVNMLMFYGFGRDLPVLEPQGYWFILPLSAALSLANVALFVWHIRLYRQLLVEPRPSLVAAPMATGTEGGAA